MSCIVCKKEFIPKSHKELTCSEDCKHENKLQIKREWYQRNKHKNKEYYEKNKNGRIRKYNEDYKKLNKEKLLERKREYREKNREKIRIAARDYSKRSKLKIKEYGLKKYNITFKDYENMLTNQNNVCKICNNPEKALNFKSNEVKSLAVDHCHNTGKVRGLLCGNCNLILGSVNDSIELLETMIQYLKEHKE